jgi:LytR cell envelope-related transcriptional attenuator
LAGLVVAALGVVVAVVAAIALRHPDGWGAGQPAAARAAPATAHASPASSPASSTPAGSSHSATRSAPAPSVRLPLVVVNSTGRMGLAAAAADRFRAGGWAVSLLANFAGPVASSCVYYDPSVPHAQDAAVGLQRQFPDIRRVAARFDPLPEGPLVVVLADDYSATPPAGPSGRQRDTGAMR